MPQCRLTSFRKGIVCNK